MVSRYATWANTFADVVYRLRQTQCESPQQWHPGSNQLLKWLGAGNLIKLLFGLDYELAVMIVGGDAGIRNFGGMIATRCKLLKRFCCWAGLP